MKDLEKKNLCIERNKKYFCDTSTVYEMLLCHYYECGKEDACCAHWRRWGRCKSKDAVIERKIEEL